MPKSTTPTAATRRARPLLTILLLLLAARPALAVDDIRLTTGEVLHGAILERGDDGVVLQHPTFGRLEIPWDQIAWIGEVPPPEETPAATETGAETPEPPPGGEAETAATEVATEAAAPEGEALEAEEPEPKPWTLNIDLGLTSVSGNTEEKVLQFGWLARYRTPEIRFRWDGSYYYKESDSNATDNKLTTGAKNDWLTPGSRWFWYVSGRYDYDQFESWNQRIAGHGGPGYEFIDRPDMDFDLRAGLGLRKEIGSANDALLFEAQLGGTYEWRINDRHTLEASSFFFPIIDDPSDHRTRTSVAWRMALAQWEQVTLTFNFGLTHEYQSVVDPDKDRNDLRITAGVGFEY